jgi:hypothetical protein
MGYIPVYPWAMYGDLIGHSVVFWGAAFLASLLPVANRLQPLTIGWGSHLFIDGITHAAHANFFLYPISLVAVHSPVSYWEPEYYAWEFRIVNGILMGITAMYLVYYWWRKHRQK